MKPLLLLVCPARISLLRGSPLCLWAALLAALATGALAAAQTTTIGGRVFDPRTTSNALPLPNVLVYVTTGPVAPLPTGVQCLQPAAPTGVTAYTNTAVDGSFTLQQVPENATYTLVIQSGKWRRQFTQAVGTAPVTGLSLHMPSDHTQGDIPMIAISTGAVDGVECVLRDMGIANSEFTDDTGTANSGGHIHLYNGGGAYISTSTPLETALTDNPATLNGYDMVMFPCNGHPVAKDPAALTDVVNFANAGGRIFATHFSYDWLVPAAPYDSPFPPVADWQLNQGNLSSGTATVNTAFTDGATMAQWLQNAGATLPNQPNQISVSTLRHDLSDIIPPTQSWLTLPSTTSGPDWILQLTFNAPVNAPAAQQCGRVLFNEYHVVDSNNTSVSFPNECGAPGPMTAQEEMLEYALFDLSSFIQPVVIPTLSLAFAPSPLSVKANDSGDQVTLNVTNTSTTSAVDSSAVLTIKLPALLSATAITDNSGGWKCTVSTLTCTRSANLGPTVVDSVTLTLNVAAYPASGPPSSAAITATVSSPSFSNDVTATDQVIYRAPPAITWPTPNPIVYGVALSAAQLDATATVPGTFTYAPAAGVILPVGQHTLTAAFAPADTAHYIDATASVTLTVVPATPAVTLSAPPAAFVANPVTFTANVASAGTTPTGTVAFYDGSTQIGSSTISNGSGTMSTSSLGLGLHAIMAVYSGDSNFQGSTSAGLTVNMEDFSINHAGSGGSVTVTPGAPATYTLVIAPIGGSTTPAALTLSLDGLPAGAKAAFSPAVVPANSPAATVTLTVTPDTLSQTRVPGGLPGRGAFPVALGMVLLPLAAMRRKLRRSVWMLLLIGFGGAALAVGVSACGGVTYTPHSFTMTATATSGALSHSTSVQITVK